MISIVIPTLNEVDNVELLVEKIHEEVDRDHEIVFVDHNSIDGTRKVLQELERNDKKICLITRNRKQGIGKALKQGFEAANGNIIVQMDADFSHPVDKIESLVDRIEEGRDVAVGSRYIKGGSRNDPLVRRLFPWIGYYLYEFFFDLPVKDVTSGFKAYNVEAVERILREKNELPDGFHFQVETVFLLNHDFSMVEIPIDFKERRSGRPKYDLNDLKDNAILFIKKFYFSIGRRTVKIISFKT